MVRQLVTSWNRLSLAQQYASTSLVVLLAGMLVIGSWVSDKIQTKVVENTAAGAALYLNSFVAPELMELRHRDTLSDDTVASLTRIYQDTPLHERVPAFKIWSLDGRVLYSTNPELIGQRFPISADKLRAWRGTVTAITSRAHEENAREHELGMPLLEIYSPIYTRWGTQMLAVAEFYDDASELMRQLRTARIESWLVVAGVTGLMFLLLFFIVRRGSQTISCQQHELWTRVRQLSALLQQNRDLNDRVRNATSRAIESNERFLHRLGAELHDGPAQLLGYGLLRLDAVAAGTCDCGRKANAPRAGDIERLRDALGDALQEIRNLSTGLAIPELAELGLAQALEHAVRSHRQRTGSDIETAFRDLPDELPLPQKISLYRLVQEALNNAYQHGGGRQQRVLARCRDGQLDIEISDAGPGFDVRQVARAGVRGASSGRRLGLSGMRERIESLGGLFFLDSVPGRGTRVRAQLPLDTGRASGVEGDAAATRPGAVETPDSARRGIAYG